MRPELWLQNSPLSLPSSRPPAWLRAAPSFAVPSRGERCPRGGLQGCAAPPPPRAARCWRKAHGGLLRRVDSTALLQGCSQLLLRSWFTLRPQPLPHASAQPASARRGAGHSAGVSARAARRTDLPGGRDPGYSYKTPRPKELPPAHHHAASGEKLVATTPRTRPGILPPRQ